MATTAPTPSLTPSFIRTGVPLVVGFVLTYLAKHGLDVHPSPDQLALLELVVTGTYYTLARSLEHFVNSKFGWLLGKASAPVYVPEGTKSTTPEGEKTIAVVPEAKS